MKLCYKEVINNRTTCGSQEKDISSRSKETIFPYESQKKIMLSRKLRKYFTKLGIFVEIGKSKKVHVHVNKYLLFYIDFDENAYMSILNRFFPQ